MQNQRVQWLVLGLLWTALVGCKSENFGKTPSKETSEQSSQTPNDPPQTDNTPAIPRIEYPGDKSNFGNFEVGEEASIATDVTGTYLSVPKGVLAAGAAIAIRTTKTVLDTAIKTLKVVIPKTNKTGDENLVVLYRMTSDTGESFFGLIPKKDLSVEEEAVTFQPKGLGVYQAAVLPVFVGEARQVPILGAQNGPTLRVVSAYNTPDLANDIYLYNDTTAFVADGNGVEVLNWSAANGLSPNTRLTSAGNYVAVTGALDRVYLTAGSSGIGLIDLAKPLSIQLTDARGVTNSIALAENVKNIYLAQEKTADSQTQAGISRFDIQGTSAKYETTGVVGNTQTKDNAYSVRIEGTVAYALNALGFHSFDITQNDRINPMGFPATDGSAQTLSSFASRAYLAEKNTGVVAVDILNPSALKALGRLKLPQVVDMAGQGKYLVAVDSFRKVSLVDISDPSHMLILHQITLSGLPNRVRIFGNSIFVCMGDTGVAVLAIDEPAAP